MYRLIKPNVLFSDVVKKTTQPHTRTCESTARKPKAKIPGGTSVKWYQTMKTGFKSGNNNVYTKPRPCVSGMQSRVNNSHSKQHCDSTDSICNNNCFEVLSVEDCVSDKCIPVV